MLVELCAEVLGREHKTIKQSSPMEQLPAYLPVRHEKLPRLSTAASSFNGIAFLAGKQLFDLLESVE
jgi:hypothetical protein